MHLMIKKLLPYIARYKVLLITGFFLVVIKNLFQSIGPQLVRGAIDFLSEASAQKLDFLEDAVEAMAETTGFSLLVSFILAFLLAEALHGLLLYFMRQTLIVSSRKIEFDIRNDLFGHLQMMDVRYFQTARTGDLMSRLTNDLNYVRDVLGPGIMYTCNTVVSFFYVVPLIIQINLQLTLISFVPLFLLSYAIYKISESIHHRSRLVQEKISDISSKAQENFSGIRVIQSYTRESNEIEQFEKLNRDYLGLNMALVKVRGLMMSSVVLTIGLSVACLLWFGGHLVIEGRITLGEFTAFNLYLGILIWPMISLGWVMNIFQRGSAAMARLDSIQSQKPQISDGPDVTTIAEFQGSVVIKNLTFSYDEHAEVLKGISLNLKAGETLGVVGSTGCGKTSLVSLIPRIYEIPHDTVFIDGNEIHKIPLQTLRRHVGMVPQDPFLFSGSIMENLIFGVENSSFDAVERAAEIAQLKSTIEEFPEKYETIIGERGITLSGGQKQRLAIARAVIKNPSILILDDSLSSVDTETEARILQEMRRVMRERTTLIVSHRLSTVQNADLIIVLDEGRIVEKGTHSELMSLGKLYYEMFQRQLLEDEIQRI